MFQHDYKHYQPIANYGWIANLWKFVSVYRIDIKRTNTPIKFRIRQDSYLVQKVFEEGQWTKTQKNEFNICRLYLKVELLSDIITAKGTHIKRHILNGEYIDICTEFCTSNFQSPHPITKAWKSWKLMLRTTYGIDEYGNIIPAVDPIPPNKVWEWYLQPSTDRIIRYQGSALSLTRYKQDHDIPDKKHTRQVRIPVCKTYPSPRYQYTNQETE
jgi:hypothetical protein